MEVLSRLRNLFADGRFDANLIAVYGIIVVTVIASLVLRRLLVNGHSRLAEWTSHHWLHAVGQEASRHARTVLFWTTVAALVLTTAGGLVYHLAGRDVRSDATAATGAIETKDWIALALVLGELVGLVVVARAGVWLVRRLGPSLEARLPEWLGRPANQEHVRHWFALLDRYAVAAVRLGAVWGAGQVVGLGEFADYTVGFVLQLVSILVVARWLTLGCKVVTQAAQEAGERHLGQGHLRRYWERISRLVPFGERCFEAAVYVSAASLCVRLLHFITVVADFGPRVVECIGILFGSRVLIELLQVLLHEAFGLYDEHGHLDQKGRTLVPLVQSICQYVIYFGSAVIMLGVLGFDTKPILAGAGIIGLAVGLGAQNLVTDLVSGFFILFEGQFLVGDYVTVADASGTVEAVGIRLTQIRDAQGKLYLIPNGQIKGVVNYSKGYINAVVDLKVPAGADLEGVFRAMSEAGRRLRHLHPDVLADTEVHGLIDLGAADMTVRAVTKVQPGTHVTMQNEYRRLLKEVFDQNSGTAKTLLAA
jgi:small conductance mechanosensitive channel